MMHYMPTPPLPQHHFERSWPLTAPLPQTDDNCFDASFYDANVQLQPSLNLGFYSPATEDEYLTTPNNHDYAFPDADSYFSARGSLASSSDATSEPWGTPQRLKMASQRQYQAYTTAPSLNVHAPMTPSVTQTPTFSSSHSEPSYSPRKFSDLDLDRGRARWTAQENAALVAAYKRHCPKEATIDGVRQTVPWSRIARDLGGKRSGRTCGKHFRYLFPQGLPVTTTQQQQYSPIEQQPTPARSPALLQHHQHHHALSAFDIRTDSDLVDAAHAHSFYKRGKWTEDEDLLLSQLVEPYLLRGRRPSWTRVGGMMQPARSGLQVQARWSERLDESVRRGRWTDREDAVLIDGVRRFGRRWQKIAATLVGRTQRQCLSRYLVLTKSADDFLM